MALKRIELVKGHERHIITYAPGDERTVLDELVAMVKNPAISIDWFDAAMLSHQLGKEHSKELKNRTPPEA